MDICHVCQTPYGKRKRCYKCDSGKRKTGGVVKCQQCGREFYVQRNVLLDKSRNSGTYCSNKCKYAARGGTRQPFKKSRLKEIKHSNGYIWEWVGYDYPGNHTGRVLQHRLVMEQHLTRQLRENEEVHHINHNKTDNRIENLELITSSLHHKRHPQVRNRIKVICGECGKEFETIPAKKETRKYCALSCKHKAFGRKQGELRHARANAKATV